MNSFGNTSGGSNLFEGSNTNTTPATGSESTNNTTQPSLFGTKPTGLFGGGATTGTGSGGLFGGGPTPSSGGLFGGSSNTTTAPNIFGGGASATTTTGQATTPAATTTSTPSSNPLFSGGFGLPKPADQSAKPAGSSFFSQPPAGSTPVAGGGLLGTKPGDSTTPSTTNTSAPSNNLFGGGNIFGKPAATSTPSATSATSPAAAPSGGLFSNLSTAKPAEAKNFTTSTTAPTSNLFGGQKADDKKDAPAPAALFNLGQTTSTKPADTLSLTKPDAPATTCTAPIVAVPPPSMLRGKTIEEIVNKWSTELETQVREFNKFAGEVAVWDRALIESGYNLAALYSHVQAAEREQNDIDQSLDHIEQQQKELASTLTEYEKVTQEILGSQGGSLRALDSGPADTERDKNYMLATDLHTHLDDLSSSLTQMIDSVNTLSLPSNDTSSGDDPMHQIAEILSSHLESLQWIDGAVREVESKVTEVEKRVKESGHGTANGSGQKGRGFGLYR